MRQAAEAAAVTALALATAHAARAVQMAESVPWKLFIHAGFLDEYKL